MLTPANVAADLAADHTRTLLAEAEAHRLARTATAAARPPAESPRRWWSRPRPELKPSAGTA